MKINKYLPFAFLYFFLNSLALPFGLTYTALLAPFFYVWVLLIRKKEIVLPFIAFLSPFILVHLLYVDIDRRVYFNSLANIILVYIFCQAVYTFLKTCRQPEKIFKSLVILNFFFCLPAVALYFTKWHSLVWVSQNLTEGVNDFQRLKLFTYEPSYYATLMVPLFCFYMLQYFFRQHTIKARVLLVMLFVPYVLSFSFGVLAALFLSWFLLYLVHFRVLTRKRRIFHAMIFTMAAGTVLFLVVYLFFPDSFLVLRIENILSGSDTSGKGRTSDAFVLAGKFLGDRHDYWGIGLGQIKIIGTAILRKYYMYSGEFVATLPNAAAETLAIFGWIGFILRLFLEFFFFFRTKAWTNYYRLWLFLFMFIYQFTGSFITNIAEYVIWILAFTNVFYQFDVGSVKKWIVIPPRLLSVE